MIKVRNSLLSVFTNKHGTALVGDQAGIDHRGSGQITGIIAHSLINKSFLVQIDGNY